jgi:hypothetical protein
LPKILSPLLPDSGGQDLYSQNVARRHPVPVRARLSPHDPDLRPAPPVFLPKHRRAHFRLKGLLLPR